jgi:hypothetical protein
MELGIWMCFLMFFLAGLKLICAWIWEGQMLHLISKQYAAAIMT